MIDVRNLQKTYPGGVEAVRDISFSVRPGEVFGLLGPNGAGKSTTIGMLTTTVRPTSGTASLAGFDVATEPLAARAVSAVVFQDAVVDASLTGRKNLQIHARLWGLDAPTTELRIDDIVDTFDLAALIERPVATYSGGERRRLEIARSLVSRPSVLFLDEPTVGLDPRIRFELLDVISGLRDRTAMTILLTTHYLDEAERLCDRIAIVHSGRIVALDTPAALRETLGPEVLEVRLDTDGDYALRTLRTAGIAGADAFSVGNTLTIPLRGVSYRGTIDAIEVAGVATTAIALRPPTLDDVYLRLTGSRLAA